MLLRCNNCDEVFDEDDLESRSECVGEFWGSPAYDSYGVCPFCGSDDYDEYEDPEEDEEEEELEEGFEDEEGYAREDYTGDDDEF